jgi:DNA-binding transcriptional ArsR family regulator
MMDVNKRAVELAEALADPLRLMVLQHLMSGSATVSELMSVTGAAQSKVSNHLRLLRQRGLVRAVRQGRQRVYTLRDQSIARLIGCLLESAGATPPRSVPPAVVRARTCYGHLGGRAGVAIFQALVAKGALKRPPTRRDGSVAARARRGPRSRKGLAQIAIGPKSAEVFGKLGIELEEQPRRTPRFALACPDWTERIPHLGGDLGARVWRALLQNGWAVRLRGTRAVRITDSGRRALRRLLGIHIEKDIP